MKSILLGTLAFLGTLASGQAGASLLISDINLEVRDSSYTVTDSSTALDAYNQFLTGNEICNTSVSDVDYIGSVQTCNGPRRNIATLITVMLHQDQNVLWQFGADWGLGGTIFEPVHYSSPESAPYTGNYWWSRDWNHSDVVNFETSVDGYFTMQLLGFENCCGGGMSLRYSLDDGQSWQVAAVNVPEPASLVLLGLGLAGLGFARRRKA